jgi:DNA-binding MarR family transcriptional regulator
MSDTALFSVAIEIQVYAALLLKFFNQALEERLRQDSAGISAMQHGILRMLQVDTLTISELSQRLGYDPSTLVRAVDSLERKELVRRRSDPNDRRRNPITITGEGLALVARIPVVLPVDPVFQALQSFGVESCIQLRDSLRELIVELPEGKRVAGLMAGQIDGR